MSDGMFLSACREVAKEFPDITYDEDLLDRVCLQVCHVHCSAQLLLIALFLNRITDNAESQTIWGSCHGHAQPVR